MEAPIYGADMEGTLFDGAVHLTLLSTCSMVICFVSQMNHKCMFCTFDPIVDNITSRKLTTCSFVL